MGVKWNVTMNILAKRESGFTSWSAASLITSLCRKIRFFCLVGENLLVTAQASARRRAAEGDRSFRTAGSVAKYTSESEER